MAGSQTAFDAVKLAAECTVRIHLDGFRWSPDHRKPCATLATRPCCPLMHSVQPTHPDPFASLPRAMTGSHRRTQRVPDMQPALPVFRGFLDGDRKSVV